MILFVVYVIIALCNFCLRNKEISHNTSKAYIKIIKFKPAKGPFENVVFSFCYNNKQYTSEDLISYGELSKYNKDSIVVVFDSLNPNNCKISEELSKPLYP